MQHTRGLLAQLAANLRWIWNGEFDHFFSEIDRGLWHDVNHNPTAFLVEVDDAKLETIAQNSHYRARLERACQSLRQYVQGEQHWTNSYAPGLASHPIAYFSAEFGLHESLPVYSGGLGVLAGDYLKSSSDLGLPVWGVTILYRDGYFIQHIEKDGVQQEVYTDLNMGRVPLERVLNREGQPLSIKIAMTQDELTIDVWKTQIGRAHLILLDGYGGPNSEDRYAYVRRLYGGDLRTRLMQEIILGIGGYRAMQAIGLRPETIHLNEGHSAFAILESIIHTMEVEGVPFEEAAERTRAKTVFTTHTPVAAGHDRFPQELILEHLKVFQDRLGISPGRFMSLGRVNPEDPNETFCMTVFALKFARYANGVSTLHGQVTRSMWQNLWPGRVKAEIPIGHITNGVHVPTWIAPRMSNCFARFLGKDWIDHICSRKFWENVDKIDPFELWDVKCAIKREIIAFLGHRIKQRHDRLGLPVDLPPLNPDALTIGFARRITEYKRPALIFKNPDRLAALLSKPEHPIQIVFCGKAHPYDNVGKGILQYIHNLTRDPRFIGKVYLIENYDMNVARHLVQGCDLWLNNPRRPLEACGTSGQKAIFNATLNFSILDGWWAEAYDHKNGYAIGAGLTHSNIEIQDQRDATDLLDALESQIIPDYFSRSPEGVPLAWTARILRGLATMAWRYNSDRMVIDYATQYYASTAGILTSEIPENR